MDARLDGTGPLTPADAAPLPAGGVALLSTLWRVHCQEVGGLTGPFLLELRWAWPAAAPWRTASTCSR